MCNHFDSFFATAVGHDPYPYQSRIATGEHWPHVIRAPTGTGKTAAVILAWLWRRRFHPSASIRRSTPRRLVYCLPMRVLVEQVRDASVDFLRRVDIGDTTEDGIGVHVLMGGDVDEEWYLYPERESILIGTQDMLLSRALNRGYVLSRFRWPIAYGLLNSDALWILDEVQLMGAGLPTTLQLAAFREALGTMGCCHTTWMSATLKPSWLNTVDHSSPPASACLELSAEEKADPRLRKLLHAAKQVRHLRQVGGVQSKSYARKLATSVLQVHRPGTQTIVFINTVGRAQDLYLALKEAGPEDVLLLHSRMRPRERRAGISEVLSLVDREGPGRIVVSTQVLEAGVDISSAVMVTELAPWPSIVQRFGRCNRYGEEGAAEMYWIDVADRHSAPYEIEECELSRSILAELEGGSGSPADLADPDLPPHEHDVLRRKDLYDLFDTSPDLSGNDVDVSRFVRSGTEADVRVFWRLLDRGEAPPPDWARPERDELCPVPVGQVARFLSDSTHEAWRWDHLDRKWRRCRRSDVWPGLVVALSCNAGGYDTDLGWYPSSRRVVTSLEPVAGEPDEAGGDDPATFSPRVWQDLPDHSDDVVAALDDILISLDSPELMPYVRDLKAAARWHDVGKAHPVFQATLLEGLDDTEKYERTGRIWAKSGSGVHRHHAREHFRHELASLLGLLAAVRKGVPAVSEVSGTALYLIASHHGRVRLSIRSLPGHRAPAQSHMILGISDGDSLPEVNVGGGVVLPPMELDLSPAAMGSSDGSPSWLSRSIAVLNGEGMGPFRLAYLEALIRAADVRASRSLVKGGT